MANSIKTMASVRFRYVVSLAIMVAVGTLFFVVSQRYTDELLMTSQVSDRLARLDIGSQETGQLGLELAQTDNAVFAATLSRAFAIRAKIIAGLMAEIDSLWPKLSAELRGRLNKDRKSVV